MAEIQKIIRGKWSRPKGKDDLECIISSQKSRTFKVVVPDVIWIGLSLHTFLNVPRYLNIVEFTKSDKIVHLNGNFFFNRSCRGHAMRSPQGRPVISIFASASWKRCFGCTRRTKQRLLLHFTKICESPNTKRACSRSKSWRMMSAPWSRTAGNGPNHNGLVYRQQCVEYFAFLLRTGDFFRVSRSNVQWPWNMTSLLD